MRIGRGRAAVISYDLPLKAISACVERRQGGRFEAVSQKTCLIITTGSFARKGYVKSYKLSCSKEGMWELFLLGKMMMILKITLITILLSLSACSHKVDTENENERILNAPKNKEEAAILMKSLDIESETNGWNRNLTREFRRKMKSRLISAGLKEDEVNKWTES